MNDKIEKLWAQCVQLKRVTPEYINEVVITSPREVASMMGKETHVSIELPNGFTVSGRAAVVDKSKFDLSVGEPIALKRIEESVWQLEGYRLQQELFEAGEQA